MSPGDVGIATVTSQGVAIRRLSAVWALHIEAERLAVTSRLRGAGLMAETVAADPAEGLECPDLSIRTDPGNVRRAQDLVASGGWMRVRDGLLATQGSGDWALFRKDGVTLEVGAGQPPRRVRFSRQAAGHEPWTRQYANWARPWRVRFRERDYVVLPGVYLPNPKSSSVIDIVLECLRGSQAPRILEAGSGAGAYALALAHERSDAKVTGLELTRWAILNARLNSWLHQLQRVRFVRSDLLQAVSPELNGQIDFILANLPYVSRTARLQAELSDKSWRGPLHTVEGRGLDGLDLLRAAALEAWTLLRPGGHLLFELSWLQKDRLEHDLIGLGYETLPAGDEMVLCRRP